MKVENKISTYTTDIERSSVELIVKNVFNRSVLVEVQIGESKVIVNAKDLIRAIQNSSGYE